MSNYIKAVCRTVFSVNKITGFQKVPVITLLLLSLCSGRSFSQEFQFQPQRFWNIFYSDSIKTTPPSGGSATTYNDSLPITKHDKWDYMVATSTWNTEFKFKSVVDIIRVGVNWDQKKSVANYKYQIDLAVTGKTTPTGSFTTKNISLVVEYNKDSLQVHNDQSAFKLDAGFHMFYTKITGIRDISGGTAVNVNRSAATLLRNFYIETEIQVQRYDLFIEKPLLVQASTPYVKGGDYVQLFWGFYGTGGPGLPSPCGTTASLTSPRIPLMYELEWQYVDDYNVAINSSGTGETTTFPYSNNLTSSFPTLSYNFKNNATRIRTWNASYKIPANYEHGLVIFRVRYIRPDTGNYEKYNYSAWSIPDAGTITFTTDLCFRNSAAIIYQAQQNDSVNWQYSVNFAEDGKYKHVLNYFDGSGNNRQTQTKINTDNNYVVVADKIYDYEGRPAIQTLPIPVQSTDLNYKPDVSLNAATGTPYKAADFDFGCTADSIVPFKSTSLAYKYYSTLNPDKAGMQQFVPDAEGYPFVETIYAPDNTNKVIWQGGAGLPFQKWKGHGTRYAYVRAQQGELNRLMGAEAGWFEYYPKQIVSDANGQYSYSIYNATGKVVATALLGTAPSSTTYPITALSSLPTPTTSVPVDLLAKLTQKVGDGKRIAEHTFFAEAAGLNKLKYGVSIPAYNPSCGSEYINVQGKYDVKVVDECGNVELQQQGTAGVSNIIASSAAQNFSGAEFTGTLPVDKYSIVKELYFPDTAIIRLAGLFTDAHTGINNCYIYQDSFVRRAVDAAVFPCTEAPVLSSCDQRKAQMMQELYPDAKYGDYTKHLDGSFSDCATYTSIFTTITHTSSDVPELPGTLEGGIWGENTDRPYKPTEGYYITPSYTKWYWRKGDVPDAWKTCTTDTLNCEYFAYSSWTTNMRVGVEPTYFWYTGATDFKTSIYVNDLAANGFVRLDILQDRWSSGNLTGVSVNGVDMTIDDTYTGNIKKQVLLSNFVIGWNEVIVHVTPAYNATDWYDWRFAFTFTKLCSSCDNTPNFTTTENYRYQEPCVGSTVTIPRKTVTTIGGIPLTLIVNVPIAEATPDELIANFNDAIAEALLPLHPEYCKLLVCEDGDFDNKMANIETYKEAEALGMNTLSGILSQDPLNQDVDSDAPLTANQLSYFGIDALLTGTGETSLLRRLDTFSLEQAYCGCNSMEAYLYCKNGEYAGSINTMSMPADDIKDLYFQKLKGNYLSNRNYLKQKAMDQSASCNPCADARIGMVLGDPVFPVLFEDDGTSVSSMMDLPSWAAGIIELGVAGSEFGATMPTEIADSIAKNKERQRNTQIDQIMGNLLNCAGVTVGSTKYTNIRAALVTAAGSGDGSAIEPANVKSILASNSVAMTDLCNPFLAEYGLFDADLQKDKTIYDCRSDIFYTDLNDFLNSAPVKTALSNATATGGATSSAISIPANTTDEFEQSLCGALGISVSAGGSYTIKGYTSTVAEAGSSSSTPLKYYKLLLKNGTYTDTLFFTNRRVKSSDFACFSSTLSPSGLAISSFSFANTRCVQDDPYVQSMDNSYIAGNVAFSEFTTGTCGQYVVWSHKIPLTYKVDPEGLIGCLNCQSMKVAVDSFYADTANYKMTPYVNHPLFDKTFSNYLNYKLGKRHTYEEYSRLMSGCAISDKIKMKRSRGTYMLQFAGSGTLGTTNAETFLTALATNFPDVYSSVFYFKRSTGTIVMWIDFNSIREDQLYAVQNYISTYTSGTPTKSWLSFDANNTAETFIKTGCTALSISGATVTDETVQVKDADGNFQSYVWSKIDATDDTPLGTANVLQVVKDYLADPANTCSKSYVLYDHELFRSSDYSNTTKQSYLTYAYGLTGTPEAVNEKLLPRTLKTAVTAFTDATTKLSYVDPWCSNSKEDLNYYYDNTSPVGFSKLITILTQVKTTLGSSKLFPVVPVTAITPGTLGSGGTSLKAINMADGGTWYQLFDQQNRRYNVYLYPSKKMIGSPNDYTMVTGTSTFPNPYRIPSGDSIYTFKVDMIKGTHTVSCYGYTDFALSAGGRLKNVVLFDNRGVDNCTDTMPCERQVYNNAVLQGKILHGEYIDSIKNAHYLAMRNYFPASSVDTLKFTTQQQQYHYTLYYYDLAGNLTRTVPPVGVTPLTITTEAADATVNTNRSAGSLTLSKPAHTKVSIYRYNTYNLLTSQVTPDGDTSNFYYDASGRLAFSQNAQQKIDKKYSYTLYDDQGRIKETGQFFFDTVGVPSLVRNSQNYTTTFIESVVVGKVRENVVGTYYDEALLALSDEAGLSSQDNLRKRVSSILYAPYLAGGDTVASYFAYGTHFSYDALGNVSTLVQDNPYLDYMKQRYKRVDYDYDLLSGKVNMVSYNRGFADQYFQKYSYDADNRITTVESSKDGLIWDRDAAYEYYKHGPLAKMQLGELGVQTVQYAYTLQGWLKSINGDVLNSAEEMGLDGNGGGLYPKDVVAHTLDYFKNDYKQIGTQAVMHLAQPTTELFNGNIARQTTAIASMDNLQRTYQYDQLNRLLSTQYATVNNTSHAIASIADYRNTYTYDADGNISKLVRKAAAGAALDSFSYVYASGKNRLLQVTDYNTTTGGTDLKNGQAANNYVYDAIGNLVKDKQAKYGDIRWNLYNKVTRIVDTTTNGTAIYYNYDGTGNRIRKDVVKFGLSGFGADGYRSSDVYVRDASGNILAVYKGTSRIADSGTIAWVNDDITSSHGSWETTSGTGLSPFIVYAYGADASFSTSLISTGITASSTWSNAKSNAYNLNFYLLNGNSLYALAMQPFASYFRPMATDTAGLITVMLSANNFSASQPLIVPLLSDQAKSTGTLTQLNNATPSLMIATLTNAAVANAGTLTSQQRLTSAQSVLSSQGASYFYGAFLAAAQVNPTVTPTFYRALVKDTGIITNAWLTTNTTVANTMGGQMTTYSPRAGSSWYMANRLNTTQPTWLTQNSTLNDRLNVVYQYDRDSFMLSYLTGIGVTPLNKTLIGMTGLTIGKYLDDIKKAVLYGGTLNPDYVPPQVSTPDPENLVSDTLYLAEHHLYGSSRLGIKNYDPLDYRNIFDGSRPPGTEMTDTSLSQPRAWYSSSFADWIQPLKTTVYTGSVLNVFTDTLRERRYLGRKNYEMTDHLGNVLAVILDRKTGYTPVSGLYTGYSADLASVTDYYPFGMPMPGRNKEARWTRFGYRGKENDDEVYGEGSLMDFGGRALDTRIGRWLAVDPLSEQYPYLSTYNYVANNPNLFVDPDGEVINIFYKNKQGELTSYKYGSDLKAPKDKFVRQTIRTLDKIQRKGKDPLGIISYLANSAEHNIGIQLPDPSDASVLLGGNTISSNTGWQMMEGSDERQEISSDIPSMISWHPKVGYISGDLKSRQSPANEILHELAHQYFEIMDIGGFTSRYKEALFTPGSDAINLYFETQTRESGDYGNYADKWIIQEVEPKFGEGVRKDHNDGFHLKVWFGTFSKFGFKIFKKGKEGTVGDIKNNRPLKEMQKKEN